MKEFIKILSIVLGFSLIVSSCNLEDNHVEFSQPEQITDYLPITGEDERQNREGHIIMRNSCVCSKGESIGLNYCTTQCYQETSPWDEGTYLLFNIDEIGTNLYKFCNNQDGDTFTKQCFLEFKDEIGNIQNQSFEPSPNQTHFKVDISSLEAEQTYRVKIKEFATDNSSTVLQFRFISNIYVDDSILQLMPVSSYICSFNSDNYEDRNVEEFYFISENRPEPLLDFTMENVLCHNLQDSPTPINDPLMEETAGVFTLWNKNDHRFFDLDSDGKIEIHNNIERSLSHRNFPSNVEIFYSLNWITGLSPDGQEVVEKSLGYVMTPFNDPNTFKTYCPQKEHFYQSYDGLLNALRPYIQMDTEGIYLAKEESHCNQILASETTLKKIAFYESNGSRLATEDLDNRNFQIKFFWPANFDEPFVKHANQKTFILTFPYNIPDWCPQRIEPNLRGTYTKIVGCAPKLVD